jgi:hypothetical protein
VNIIIVFTSPSGKTDEYATRWWCINPDNTCLCKKKWEDDKGTNKLFIFNGKTDECTNYHNTSVFDKMTNQVKEIVDANGDAETVVLFHTSNRHDVARINQELKEFSPTITIYQYSSARAFGGLDIWEKHIKNFCDNDGNIEEKFMSLWNYLQGINKKYDLYRLRYEILSPLVALDWITQAKKDGDIKEKISKAFENILQKDGSKDLIDKLSDILRSYNAEELRCFVCKCMESSTINHSELLKIACDLEEKIEKLFRS